MLALALASTSRHQSRGLTCQESTLTEDNGALAAGCKAVHGPRTTSQWSGSLQGAAAHQHPGVVVIKDPGPEPGKGPGELPRSLSCAHGR